MLHSAFFVCFIMCDITYKDNSFFYSAHFILPLFFAKKLSNEQIFQTKTAVNTSLRGAERRSKPEKKRWIASFISTMLNNRLAMTISLFK